MKRYRYINVEKNELEVDPRTLEVEKDFRNKPYHPPVGIDKRGTVSGEVGNVIIPKEYRYTYLTGSPLIKKHIIDLLTLGGGGERMQGGGEVQEGEPIIEDDKKKALLKRQEELHNYSKSLENRNSKIFKLWNDFENSPISIRYSQLRKEQDKFEIYTDKWKEASIKTQEYWESIYHPASEKIKIEEKKYELTNKENLHSSDIPDDILNKIIEDKNLKRGDVFKLSERNAIILFGKNEPPTGIKYLWGSHDGMNFIPWYEKPTEEAEIIKEQYKPLTKIPVRPSLGYGPEFPEKLGPVKTTYIPKEQPFEVKVNSSGMHGLYHPSGYLVKNYPTKQEAMDVGWKMEEEGRSRKVFEPSTGIAKMQEGGPIDFVFTPPTIKPHAAVSTYTMPYPGPESIEKRLSEDKAIARLEQKKAEDIQKEAEKIRKADYYSSGLVPSLYMPPETYQQAAGIIETQERFREDPFKSWGMLGAEVAGMIPLLKGPWIGARLASKGMGALASKVIKTDVVKELRQELLEKGIVKSQKTPNLPWKEPIRKGVEPMGFENITSNSITGSKFKDVKGAIFSGKNPLYRTEKEWIEEEILKKKIKRDSPIRYFHNIKDMPEIMKEPSLKKAIDIRDKYRITTEGGKPFSFDPLSNRYATWDMYLGKPQTKHPLYDISELTTSKKDVVYTIKEDFMNKSRIEFSLSGHFDDIEYMMEKNMNTYHHSEMIGAIRKKGDSYIVPARDSDMFGTMRGFHWEVSKLPDGNYKVFANDVWDLHPLREVQHSMFKEKKPSKLLQPFKNIEVGKALGIGKPLNVKVGFIIDEKTKKIINTFGLVPAAIGVSTQGKESIWKGKLNPTKMQHGGLIGKVAARRKGAPMSVAEEKELYGYVPFKPTAQWQIDEKERLRLLREQQFQKEQEKLSKVYGARKYTYEGKTYYEPPPQSGAITPDYTPEMIAGMFIGVPPVFKGASTLSKVGNIATEMISPFRIKGAGAVGKVGKGAEPTLAKKDVDIFHDKIMKKIYDDDIKPSSIFKGPTTDKEMLRKTGLNIDDYNFNEYLKSINDPNYIITPQMKSKLDQLKNIEFNAVSGGRTFDLQNKLFGDMGKFGGKKRWVHRDIASDIKDIDEVSGGFHGTLPKLKPFSTGSPGFEYPMYQYGGPILPESISETHPFYSQWKESQKKYPGIMLKPLEVKAAKDPTTDIILNKLSNESLLSKSDVFKMWEDAGKPKIQFGDKKGIWNIIRGGSDTKYRANYNAFTNTINIRDTTETKRIDRRGYSAELAHAYQYNVLGRKIFDEIKDWYKYPYISVKGYEKLYSNPGTGEYQEAKILGPQYRMIFSRGKLNKLKTSFYEPRIKKFQKGGPILSESTNRKYKYKQ